MRRLAIVEVSDELAGRWCSMGISPRSMILAALPPDATLVEVVTDPPRRATRMKFESDAFEPVPEGATIPTLDVRFPALPPSTS